MRTTAHILLGGIFAAFLLSSFVLGVLPLFQGGISAALAPEPTQTETTTTAEIVFVGDVLLARAVERNMTAYGMSYPFTHMETYLDAPVVVGNFEAAVPGVHVPTPDLTTRFSVDQTLLPALAEAGFTHMSLANNHAYDFGSDAFDHTVAALTAIEVVPFGRPYELSSTSISYVEVGELRVALIGVFAVDSIPSMNEIEETVSIASAASDLQIVYVHWGAEYRTYHSKTQEQLAHTFIDAGVDMIVGHHPHVVQDVEWYRGAPIFYSLGNFVFDQYFSPEVQRGLLLSLKTEELGVLAVTLVPVSSEFSRTAPRALTGYERGQFLTALARRSDPLLADVITDGSFLLHVGGSVSGIATSP